MRSRPLVTAPQQAVAFLYRDGALLVVDKPSGLASHRGLSHELGDYLLTRVRDAVKQRVYLAHRLDRATSGAVALVTEARWVAPLQQAFQSGRVLKQYLAIVRGVMPEEAWVDYPIPRSAGGERVSAQTRFRRLAVFEETYSLVEAEPVTGRYHQIRRHLSHLRHPILGDTTYGDGKRNRAFRARFGLMRLALHASVLSLPHPMTGQRVTLRAPLAADMRATFAAMGWSTRLSELLSCDHPAANGQRQRSAEAAMHASGQPWPARCASPEPRCE